MSESLTMGLPTDEIMDSATATNYDANSGVNLEYLQAQMIDLTPSNLTDFVTHFKSLFLLKTTLSEVGLEEKRVYLRDRSGKRLAEVQETLRKL